jgi:hypothetical protein
MTSAAAESKSDASLVRRALPLFAKHRISAAIESTILNFVTADVWGELALLSKSMQSAMLGVYRAATELWLDIESFSYLRPRVTEPFFQHLPLAVKHCSQLRSISLAGLPINDWSSLSAFRDWLLRLIDANRLTLQRIELPISLCTGEFVFAAEGKERPALQSLR